MGDLETSRELVGVHTYLEDTGDITGVEQRLGAIVAAGHYAELRSAARAMRQFLKLVSAWEREHITANGPIQSHGTTYGLRTERVAEIDVPAAWPVLREWLGDKMTAAVSVSLPKAKKVAQEMTKHGDKGHAAKGLELALQDVGAITWRERVKVAEKRGDTHDAGDEEENGG